MSCTVLRIFNIFCVFISWMKRWEKPICSAGDKCHRIELSQFWLLRIFITQTAHKGSEEKERNIDRLMERERGEGQSWTRREETHCTSLWQPSEEDGVIHVPSTECERKAGYNQALIKG